MNGKTDSESISKQLKNNKLNVKSKIDDLRTANNESGDQQKRVNHHYENQLK